MSNTSTDQDRVRALPISRAAVAGVFWLMFNQLLSRGFVTVGLLAIGATAGPEVFAPMAVIAMFLALSSSMFEDVFVYQLVRSNLESRDLQFRAARLYAICLAAIVSVLVYPLTPFLAELARLPEIEGQLRWCLLAVWAHALQVPVLAWLRMEMKFRQQSLLALPSLIIVLVLALVSLTAFGPTTALLVLAVGSACVQVLIFCLWRPSLLRGWSSDQRVLRQFVQFGGRLYLANLMNIGFAGLYVVIIARLFAGEALGQYFFADKARELLILPFMGALQTVVYSELTRADDGGESLAHAFRLALGSISLVVVPVCLFVAGYAPEVFELLLDDSWVPAASYLALMALATMFVPLHAMNLTANKVLGRGDWLLRIELAKKLLAVMVLLFSVRWGVPGIVAGQLFMAIVSVFINGVYASGGVGITIGRQLLIFMPYLVIGGVALTVSRFFSVVLNVDGWPAIVTGGTLAIAVYLALNKLLRTEGFQHAERILRHNRD